MNKRQRRKQLLLNEMCCSHEGYFVEVDGLDGERALCKLKDKFLIEDDCAKCKSFVCSKKTLHIATVVQKMTNRNVKQYFCYLKNRGL